jgi:hypothetical protein
LPPPSTINKKGVARMIKPITKNDPENESHKEYFDAIIENFINGNEMLGREQFKSLSEASMMSLLKHLSERPDKAEIHKKLKSNLDKLLKK